MQRFNWHIWIYAPKKWKHLNLWSKYDFLHQCVISWKSCYVMLSNASIVCQLHTDVKLDSFVYIYYLQKSLNIRVVFASLLIVRWCRGIPFVSMPHCFLWKYSSLFPREMSWLGREHEGQTTLDLKGQSLVYHIFLWD